MLSTSPNNLPAISGGPPEFPDGPPDWPINDGEIQKRLEEAFQNGSWGKYHGLYCDQLSNRIAEYQSCKHVTLCSSGTAAIELALRGLKIGQADEVILAAYDFDGNYRNIILLGAIPVLVDVSSENWNIDLGELKKAINKKTKAILVSHLHGGIVRMQELMEIASKKGISVIEDACQMPGAMIDGEKSGSRGDIGIFSFGGSKTLSAGRGGALFTNQEEIFQRIHLYQNRGNEAYPLSELQAAVLLPQLEKLEDRNRKRTESVEILKKALKDISGINLFNTPETKNNSQPGYYKVGLQYQSDEFSNMSRSLFCNAMQAEGVAMFEGFRSFHCIHSSRRFLKQGDLKQATDADQNCIVLHHPVLLQDEPEILKIASAIQKIKNHSAKITEQFN